MRLLVIISIINITIKIVGHEPKRSASGWRTRRPLLLALWRSRHVRNVSWQGCSDGAPSRGHTARQLYTNRPAWRLTQSRCRTALLVQSWRGTRRAPARRLRSGLGGNHLPLAGVRWQTGTAQPQRAPKIPSDAFQWTFDRHWRPFAGGFRIHTAVFCRSSLGGIWPCSELLP